MAGELQRSPASRLPTSHRSDAQAPVRTAGRGLLTCPWEPSSRVGLALILILLTVAGALLAAGCGTDRVTAPADRYVEGVNFGELFAPPGADELRAVRAAWDSHLAVAVDAVQVAASTVQIGATRFDVRLFSHRVDGDLHYGVAAVPADASRRSAPVVLYAHFGQEDGYGGGLSVDAALMLLALSGGFRPDAVYALPCFRSQHVVLDGATYRAEGRPDPWDGQVDDALAFLEVVRQEVPEADGGRIAALGLSGGGAVALLAAAREPAIDGVAAYFPPTDFLGPFIQGVFERALRGEHVALPGFGYLQSDVLTPLRAGELSVAQVRLELIRRSAVYFVDRLPALQVHHGAADTVVPVSQARALQSALRALADGERREVWLYDGGVHNPLALPGCSNRVASFLARALGPAPAARVARGPILPVR